MKAVFACARPVCEVRPAVASRVAGQRPRWLATGSAPVPAWWLETGGATAGDGPSASVRSLKGPPVRWPVRCTTAFEAGALATCGAGEAAIRAPG